MSAVAHAVLRPVVFLLCLALLGLPGAQRAAFGATDRDEVVPAGVWLTRASLSVDAQDTAAVRDGGTAPLKEYLLPQRAVRAQVDGSVSRRVTEAALQGTYGITDAWNVSLKVPHVSVRYDASLRYTGDDTATAERVDEMARDRAGLGDVRLLSLHRPVFGDRNAFTFGYGLSWPGSEANGPYTGLGGEVVHHYGPALLGVLHYTRYPALGRSRFDARVEVRDPRATKVEVAGVEGKKPYVGGRETTVTLGWASEVQRFTLAGEGELYVRTPTTVDNALQNDPVYDYTTRLRVGYGNLVELERGRPAFPYRVDLSYERTLGQMSFNTPLHNRVSLSLLTYF